MPRAPAPEAASAVLDVLIADEIAPQGLALLCAAEDLHVDDRRLSRAELLASIGQYDALVVRSGTPVDQDLMARSPRLRLIARAGLAFDNIDVAAATERGIMVMHAPEAYGLAAAEHTLALMLALYRNVPAADASVRRGEWDRGAYLGAQLQGQTLGLIGFGRVGRLVAARAAAFGMEVLVCDPYVDEAEARSAGVTLGPLDELLSRADCVTLHAALTSETERLLGPAEIAQLKLGARLVNCARAELVDEAALHTALVSGRLAGAALDVFAHEPPVGSPPAPIAERRPSPPPGRQHA